VIKKRQTSFENLDPWKKKKQELFSQKKNALSLILKQQNLSRQKTACPLMPSSSVVFWVMRNQRVGQKHSSAICLGLRLQDIEIAREIEIIHDKVHSTILPFGYPMIDDVPMITPGLVKYLNKK
jgi:hypothetical protein